MSGTVCLCCLLTCASAEKLNETVPAKQDQTKSFEISIHSSAFSSSLSSFSPLSFHSPSLHQLGHNGITPESCWLVDELSVAVPTKGIKYIFPCKCWLAKDRGDGLAGRLFNVLDASMININRKVSVKLFQ